MEVLIIASEEAFRQIPKQLRDEFKYVKFKEENEYDNNKDDEVYLKLYKAKSKASKGLDEYLFNKRNK